jgi:hypothetical protein
MAIEKPQKALDFSIVNLKNYSYKLNMKVSF